MGPRDVFGAPGTHLGPPGLFFTPPELFGTQKTIWDPKNYCGPTELTWDTLDYYLYIYIYIYIMFVCV